MRTVWVVTHPEATHHVDGLVGGWFDSELTPTGSRHAAAIAGELRRRIPVDLDVDVHTSDLRRTVQTAAAIGAALGVEPTLVADLREKSYGVAEGRPQAWLDERFVPPPRVGDRMRHDEGIEGAETRMELAERVYRATEAILTGGAEHHVIVTHGFASTFVVAWWIGMPLDACGYVDLRASSGGITELHEDDRFHNRQIVHLNATAHLG